MPTADEYLREEVGRLVAHYVVQLAVARAEVDALKRRLGERDRDGHISDAVPTP